VEIEFRISNFTPCPGNVNFSVRVWDAGGSTEDFEVTGWVITEHDPASFSELVSLNEQGTAIFPNEIQPVIIFQGRPICMTHLITMGYKDWKVI
jgi:hypothetical protein